MALTADFLASDIVFPSDSNEPKLSVNHASKLPDPVDWAFHDYYSTALEKSYTPMHSLTDIHTMSACPLPSTTTTKSPQAMNNNDAQHLRAVLRGALEIVANDMERNHHGAGVCIKTSNTNAFKNDDISCWKWEDELMYDHWTLPVEQDDHFDLDSGYGQETESVLFSDVQDDCYEHHEPQDIRNDDSTSASTVAAASSSYSSTSTKWSGVVDKIKTLVKPSSASSSSSCSSMQKEKRSRLPWKRLFVRNKC
ncbi:predicted protein [Lichtheimia corymbifera JMRC:FSU:9682]|uniref:Uncharacterized protein n=1 Tax=Lichtheimia corymbifera JMRC:FSU:9682 TaxID=1263082 RepID=A0A068S7T7_9FUNG|nr:predicted protein [Lichtheimia corymbifera JMRC:FSU:9682]